MVHTFPAVEIEISPEIIGQITSGPFMLDASDVRDLLWIDEIDISWLIVAFLYVGFKFWNFLCSNFIITYFLTNNCS